MVCQTRNHYTQCIFTETSDIPERLTTKKEFHDFSYKCTTAANSLLILIKNIEQSTM